ncbi:SAM-dependent methyltransferase [Streptosporangiaceae bacterium NEAU-GS5]|nr:SAM-dependent methyltransferase [Streptosporangiaceae bacterium NEAU-GS5]
MTGSPPEWTPPGLDAARPSAARIQDALLGGGDHFEIDRMVADRLRQVVPQLSDVVAMARKFLRRAVRLLTDRGVDQFLDLGAGLPTRDNTHDMAPGARVVYVDIDPMVEAHMRLLLRENADAAAITANVRNVDAVLEHPDTRRLLDFTRPIGVITLDVLCALQDEDDPWGMVRSYMAALPSGSHLVAGDPHESGDPVADQLEQALRMTSRGCVFRKPDVIARYFDGLELLDPGLVPMAQWPDPRRRVLEPWERLMVCGVAVKP